MFVLDDESKAKSLVKANKWSERIFRRNIVRLAQDLGWLVAFVSDSRYSHGGNKGWPDLAMVKGDRIIFAELKVKKNKPTADQLRWLKRLGNAGAEVYIWYPNDLFEIGDILRGTHDGSGN